MNVLKEIVWVYLKQNELCQGSCLHQTPCKAVAGLTCEVGYWAGSFEILV